MKKANKGITLIALIITIVVMLILVGVVVSTTVNSNIIGKAKGATGDWQTKEGEEANLAGVQVGDKIYNSFQDYVSVEKTGNKTLISTSENFIGCYADFNGDGTPEGIIYADLVHTTEGIWNYGYGSGYKYIATSPVDEFKRYYIKNENYTEGDFDNNDADEQIAMIAPIEGTLGKDRFYVMALEDIELTIDGTEYNTFYWYLNAAGKLTRPVDDTYNDFGEGKNNTLEMLNDFNNESAKYGTNDPRDMWKVIQDEKIQEKYPLITDEDDSQKWFVPSKAEWSAFGDYLYTKLGTDYANYRLSYWYWSSSQVGAGTAYHADIGGGCINSSSVYFCDHSVRLSATF